MEKYKLKFIYLCAYAAVQSALNTHNERLWARLKWAHIGYRFGQAFLREADGTGRWAPTNGERPAFLDPAAKR